MQPSESEPVRIIRVRVRVVDLDHHWMLVFFRIYTLWLLCSSRYGLRKCCPRLSLCQLDRWQPNSIVPARRPESLYGVHYVPAGAL
jgi:hypothetical protein